MRSNVRARREAVTLLSPCSLFFAPCSTIGQVFRQLLEEAEKTAQSQLEAAEQIHKTVVEPIKPQAKAKVQNLRRV
jgi:hypothetical protein